MPAANGRHNNDREELRETARGPQRVSECRDADQHLLGGKERKVPEVTPKPFQPRDIAIRRSGGPASRSGRGSATPSVWLNTLLSGEATMRL